VSVCPPASHRESRVKIESGDGGKNDDRQPPVTQETAESFKAVSPAAMHRPMDDAVE